MKAILFAFALVPLISGPSFAAEGHDHHVQGAPAPQLDSGKKWETDAPLRKGMAGIRDLMAAKHGEIHTGKLKKEQYAELARKISGYTDSIFKNCKLSPKADTQLHLLLVRILDGTQAMKNAGSVQDRRAGAIKIFDALQLYPEYFNHPGWPQD
jgi:hypothetical protein